MVNKADEIITIGPSGDTGLHVEAVKLMHSIFPRREPKAGGVEWLIKTCNAACGMDVLIVHSPGGWGCSDIPHLINWERSVVDGIQEAAAKIG